MADLYEYSTSEIVRLLGIGFKDYRMRCNLICKEDKKIKPHVGNSSVCAVPMSARISNNFGLEYDRYNFLLIHTMNPKVAGVIGSVVSAVCCWDFSVKKYITA